MIYLTGVTQDKHRSALIEMGCGLIAQPWSYSAAEVAHWPHWAADNGCYTGGEKWMPERWLAWLDTLPRAGCLFATAPDWFSFPNGAPTDHLHTLGRSRPYLDTIRSLGFPAAFVLQHGVTPESIPWEDIDAVFVGGSTAFKHGDEANRCVAEARERGLWVHLGRANSHRALSRARFYGCDSADGTFLRRAPDHNLPRLREFLRKLDTMPELPMYRLTVQEWSEVTGLKPNTIVTRLRRGWPADRVLLELSNKGES